MDQNISEARNMEAQEEYKKRNVDEKANVRQAFQKLKESEGETLYDFPDVGNCSQRAPVKINVFTDGSLINTNRSFWKLAGAGVWWPDRDLSQEPLSKTELDMGIVTQKTNGVEVKTCISGYGGSSMRSELAVGILASVANQAVHIGSDSQSFVLKASRIQKMVEEGKTPRRPWSTQKDGDLWELLYNTLKRKGSWTFKVSKVKGHASDDMVIQGTVNAEDKVGNDQADIAADEGVNMHGDGIVKISRLLMKRHLEYTNLVKKVHDHMLKCHKAHKMLTKEKEAGRRGNLPKNENEPNMIAYRKPKSFASRAGRHVGDMLDIRSFRKILQQNPRTEQVQQFLKMITLESNERKEEIGTTWIELYVMYKKTGFECAVQEPANKADKKPSMGMQIKEFKRMVREVVHATMQDVDKLLFQASHHQHSRYVGCGIITHMAMINAKVVTSEAVENKITEEIVRSQRRRKQDVEDFLKGLKELPECRYKDKGRTSWSRAIKENTSLNKYLKRNAKEENNKAREQTQVVQQETKEAITREFFNCAMCGHHILADRTAFDLCDLGVKTRCKRCNNSWETKMWKCKCKLPWHKCSIHRDSPQKMRDAHEEVPQDVKEIKAKKKEAERQGRKTQVSTRKRSGEKRQSCSRLKNKRTCKIVG